MLNMYKNTIMDSKKLESNINVRLNLEDINALKQEASQLRVPLSTYCRMKLAQSIKKPFKNPYSPETVVYTENQRNENIKRIKELLKQDPKLSYRDMEKTLKEEGKSLSHVTIGNYVKQLEIELRNENKL
jgi:hypothetical protein